MGTTEKSNNEQYDKIDYELKYLQAELETFANKGIANPQQVKDYLTKKAEQVKTIKEDFRLYSRNLELKNSILKKTIEEKK